MAKRNYKFYADVGLSHKYRVRHLSLLDTGAAPNLVNSERITSAFRTHIRCGPGLDIDDFNKIPR